jgi:D-amino-acid dehydrogenase
MSKHVLIVGAGVIGLCSAYYAAKKGHRVTVIDRNPEQRDGCSFGNAGMIVPSHFVPLAAPGMVALGLKWMWNPESPFYIKPRLSGELIDWGFKFWKAANPAHVKAAAPLLRDLNLASRAAYEELAALPGVDFGLVKRGLLMLCKTQHTLDEEGAFAAKARALGVPAEVLDAKQTAKVDPAVTMDVAGAVYFPKDCHLVPGRFMAMLKQQLDQMGVVFHWDTEVTAVVRSSRRIKDVLTTKGDFVAGEFVLAGGSWSPLLAQQLGLHIPMQAGKGYSLTLPDPKELPQICSIFTEARVAVTPMGSSLRVGGTMEMSGLNEDINPARVQGIVKSVPKYYPKFAVEDFAGLKPWRGLRPCSPDGLPYMGRTAKFDNLTIATGHAMMGLSLGPVSGRLVAEIVSGDKPSQDIALLDPDRYA